MVKIKVCGRIKCRIYNPKKYEPKNRIYDVVIVGGGVTGITTAYELQKRGFQCLVAEARNLCFGTSGADLIVNTFLNVLKYLQFMKALNRCPSLYAGPIFL